MKVLVLATDVFCRGGISRYTYTLASALGRVLGPENVDVLSFFDWGYEGQQPTEFRFLGMVSGKKRGDAWSQLRFLFRAMRAGMRKYDLVVANHVALAPAAALMRLVFGTPYWVSCHSVEIWWGTSWIRRMALRRADCVLNISGYTAEAVAGLGLKRSRLKVVYNAVPDSFSAMLTREQDETAANQPTILSVCSLVPGNEFKGVDTVIAALPQILKKIPTLRYVVVGDGEIRAGLESLAATIGVRQSVVFKGEISDQELASLYRNCDLFVLPSRGQKSSGVTGGEGFGRVYVEASIAGKPVIGSVAGGAAEAVLDGVTGVLIHPNSTAAVASAVIDLLQDSDRAKRMGRAGREWALKTFSEDALTHSLAELLRPYGLSSSDARVLAHAGGEL